MVQPIDYPLRPRHADAIDRLQGDRLVGRIGARHADRQGGPAAVSQHTAFGARFGPIHRTGPRRLPAQRRLGDHPIQGLPLPGNAHFAIVVFQQHFPGSLEHPGLHPLAEAAMHSRPGRILLAWNRLPLTARAQDIEQGVEDEPKSDSRSPRRPWGFLGPQQGGKVAPQLIGHMPYCRHCGLGGHSSPPVLMGSLSHQDRTVRFSYRLLAHWPAENVIYQPANRDTAPGILLPLTYISHRDPLATVTVFPSDHFVVKEEPFLAAVGRAVAEVQHFSRHLILLGAQPDQAEGDYGWIEPARQESSRESRSVLSFVEKPSRAHACELMARGALWNTFVFAAQATTLWAMVRQTAPDLADAFERLCRIL